MLAFSCVSCANGIAASDTNAPLRLMIDRAPATLSPRRAADASGQRLGALIFRALTRIDSEQEPQPDLASGWRILDGGRTWAFDVKPGQLDHDGAPITAAKLAECLENYRDGKPLYLMKGAFPGWKAVQAQGESVFLRFEQPSPYLARNVSLLRYFRVEGSPTACTEPSSAARVIGSGPYRPEHWELAPEGELKLRPAASAGDRKALTVLFVPDDNARVLKLLRGEVDVTQSSLSITKERWLQQRVPERFDFLERDGATVTLLAFNLRDPLLARLEVRQAISLAIDRDDVVKHKLMGVCKTAGSFLSPRLPESEQATFTYDPARAEALLDQAGFARPGPGGTRFELHYRTTPVREGIETALMIQDMLSRIGIHVVLDVVEPAVFLSSIRKGQFQLSASTWVGVADGSILYRTLRSGQPDNRAGYRNAEMDRLLDQASGEAQESRRIPLLKRAQTLMATELPYFPLWYWDNIAIVRKGLKGIGSGDLSISGSYEPLTRLR